MSERLAFTGVVTKAGRLIAEIEAFGIDAPGLTCLIGPSGAGKSTLARAVALVEDDAAGRIASPSGDLLLPFGDRDKRPRRLVTYVAQQPNLWPHLTIGESIALIEADHGLLRGYGDSVAEALDIAALSGRRPATLSGGERQRAAVAMGLAPRPEFVIFDEVTANLDGRNRKRVVDLIVEVAKERGVLLVTHDLPMVDHLFRIVENARFAFMLNGKIAREGMASEWRDKAADPLRDFLREAELKEGEEL